MIDNLASFFLLFGEVIIGPLCIIGYSLSSRNIWGRAICLVFFSMFLGPLLKSIWQTPLPAWMKNDGWAFPSGHMLTSISFYLWIAYELKNKIISIIVFIILTGIAYSLVHKGYHDAHDVAWAVIFGLMTLYGYYQLNKISLFITRPDLLFLISIPISFAFVALLPVISVHVLPTFCANLFFGIAWIATNKYKTPNSLILRLFIAITASLILFSSYKLCWLLHVSQLYKMTIFAGMLGIIINYVPVFIKKIITK